MSEFSHKPIMLMQCIEGLDIKPNGIYVDGTCGGAGHSKEIAKRIDVTEKAVNYALDAIQDPLSLYEPVFHDGGETLYVMDQISDEKVLDESLIDSIALYDALKRLNEKERRIVSMRFFSEKTQMEVASEIGISQEQVKRLEKNAIEHMRKFI